MDFFDDRCLQFMLIFACLYIGLIDLMLFLIQNLHYLTELFLAFSPLKRLGPLVTTQM